MRDVRHGAGRRILLALSTVAVLGGCISIEPVATVGPMGTALSTVSVTGAPSPTPSPLPSGPPSSSPFSSPSLSPSVSPDLTAAPVPSASPSASASPAVASPSLSQMPVSSASPSLSPAPASLSPSLVPSATPSAGGFGAISPIFQDDFSEADSGWGTGQRDNGSIDYGPGHLRVDLNVPTAGLWSTRLLGGTWEVAQIEGTIQPVGLAAPPSDGYAGFLCAAGQRDYFVGLIDTRGGWVFAESVDTAVTVLDRGGAPPPDIPAGTGVRLTMQCAGAETGGLRLRLLVDGQEVSRFERAEALARFDQIGVYGEAIDPTFSFIVDDVQVRGGSDFIDPSTSPAPSPQP